MARKFKEDPQDPALKAAGFDRGWESAKYIGQNVLMTALKGALIGAAIFALASVPIGGPIAAMNWVSGLLGFETGLSAAALAIKWAGIGALVGGGLSAIYKFIESTNNVGEAMDDKEQSIVLKSKRAKQMEVNEKVLEAGLAGIPQQPSIGINSLSHGLGGLGSQKATENAYATTV